jgi:tRNA threonylcarbamoyl adenosine modification protein (Sua5/YciO/YrdC/YwlC family)
VLKEDGVLVYPTDTIYGLGCDLFSAKGIRKVLDLKKRDHRKPMSFICSDLKHISEFAVISNQAYRTMKRLLPGPYTFVLEATRSTPRKLLGRRQTVGIRIPDHPVCLALVRELGHPVISTSANLSGGETLYTPGEILESIGPGIDLLIDAGPLVSEPSSVVDLTGAVPRVLRKGKGDVKEFEMES